MRTNAPKARYLKGKRFTPRSIAKAESFGYITKLILLDQRRQPFTLLLNLRNPFLNLARYATEILIAILCGHRQTRLLQTIG
jgi:hypothetical protein